MFTNRISSSAFACTFSHHRNIVCLNPLQKLVGRYSYCHKNYKMDARTICSMVTIHLPNSFLRYLCIHSHIDNSCNLYIWVHSTVQIKSDSATQTIVLALLEILNKQQQEQQSPRRTLQHYGKKHMNNRGNKQSTKSS